MGYFNWYNLLWHDKTWLSKILLEILLFLIHSASSAGTTTLV